MLDAYTVRKAIPRIVIAVIGINLSIYLCIALIDVFNIIGGGVGNLLTAPFGEANLNEFGIQTDKANSIVAGVGVIIGAKPLLALLVGTYGAITTGGGGALLGLIFFTVILPIILVVIGIFAVVIIRQALLIFLTIISPVAIACFVLPGTEKYFQKWWGLFVKTLLVYPIIAVIFAMSDIFGSIIFSNNQGGLTGVARIITGIIVIYAPLFMIPFAFRFAGGAIAQLSKFASGAGDRVRQSGFVKARREHYGQKFQDGMTRAQEQSYDKATKDASGTGIRRQIGKFRQKAYAGYRGDIKLRMAEIGKREAEKNALITGNADDSIERAYTADQASADADWANIAGRVIDDEGRIISAHGLRRQSRDGTTEYRDAGGAWQSLGSVEQAQRTYGPRNMSAYQQKMAYAMRKATTQEEQDLVEETFARTAQSWGMSANEANAAWIGAGFANQDYNLQWKHGRWTRNDDGSFAMRQNGAAMVREIDERKGVYESGRYNADTWSTLQDEMRRADEVIRDTGSTDEQRVQARETITRGARIAHTIGQGYQYRDEETGEMRQATSIGQGAAPRTAEEMRGFHAIATEIGDAYGYVHAEYGTETVRSDDPHRVIRPRTDDPGQSLEDRDRPSVQR